jgi:hypothetical protein
MILLSRSGDTDGVIGTVSYKHYIQFFIISLISTINSSEFSNLAILIFNREWLRSSISGLSVRRLFGTSIAWFSVAWSHISGHRRKKGVRGVPNTATISDLRPIAVGWTREWTMRPTWNAIDLVPERDERFDVSLGIAVVRVFRK